jgi:hypothetical protein
MKNDAFGCKFVSASLLQRVNFRYGTYGVLSRHATHLAL